jgi:hypothetical protein
VQEALDEADDPNAQWFTQEQIEQEFLGKSLSKRARKDAA